MTVNEKERRRWNNERWAELWPKRERLTDEAIRYLLASLALQRGEKVLDAGCGGGAAALEAAGHVGTDGTVIGADFSAPLIQLARKRAQEAGIGNVTFQVADVQTDKIDGGNFDAIMSQFGVMFFDEPRAAFANIRSHLRPGGRLAFACWQPLEKNPWFFIKAVAPFLPPPPDPPPGKSRTGPFSLADRERTTAMLREAGLEEVRVNTHELCVEVPEDAVVDDVQLAMMGIRPENHDKARAAVNRHLSQFRLPSGLYRFTIAFQIFVANKSR